MKKTHHDKSSMLKENAVEIDLHRPLLKEGPKFLSHTVIIKNDLAYLMPTLMGMMFCMIYILVGAFLICLAITILVMTQQYDFVIFLGGFGIAIITFGISLIKPFLRRAYFNKKMGIFSNHKDRDVKLHHISSLQITNKIIQRKHALSYHCYELNLLTEHGRRINILNHNDQQQLIQDAHLLANFLSVDVTDYRKELSL